MNQSKRLTLFCVCTCLVTCFGVFVLPFLVPPASISAVSVSNAAGFNNKLAALAAGLCAALVFGLSVVAPRLFGGLTEWRDANDLHALPWRVWGAAALVVGGVAGMAGWVIAGSGVRYDGDVGYFVNQMTSCAVSHQQLYTQIEFPYGHLLFYPPILLHRLVGRLSIRTCYLSVVVLHQMAGLLLFGYVVNLLPMSRRWKIFALCCYAPFTLQPMVGLNYTLLRFMTPLATLMFSIRRKRVTATAVLFALGVILNLAVSPEMGFAFGTGAVAWAMLQMRRKGAAWLIAAAAVPLGGGLFLLLVGRPYLLMLSLFAGGMYNFIVEPLPHILLFLIAAVWLVPRMLAAQMRSQLEEALLLIPVFVAGMALVPAAFGRADPGHVFFNGAAIFLLSFVAMSPRARRQQLTWGACVAVSMLAAYAAELHLWGSHIRDVVQRDAVRHPDSLPSRVLFRVVGTVNPSGLKKYEDRALLDPAVFNINALRSIVGADSVATPYELPLGVEDQLRSGGLYRPDFYDYMVAVINSSAEDRKIREFNEAMWAMLPGHIEPTTATQTSANAIMGIPLPYRARRTPYVAGVRFIENLQANWRVAGGVGVFIVYCNTLNNPRCQHR